MPIKNIITGFSLALMLTSCATSQKNKTSVSSDVGYVSQESVVIKNTSSVQDILDEADDCSFLEKLHYYSQKYKPQVYNPRYPGQIYRPSPYGYGTRYQKPVVTCDPTKYTNSGAVWTIPAHQNLSEAMHSQTVRRNAKGFQFNQRGVAVVPLANSHQKSCFVLTNAKGDLIPVRKGSDPYLFSNPLLAVKHAKISKQNKLNTAKNRLNQAKSSLASRYGQLKNSRAWKRSQCALPKQKSLPRKPKTISMKEAQFQANGYCTDLQTRRENPVHVADSLGAIYADNIIEDWMKYRQLSFNQKESCARVARSQTVDWFTGLCGIVGTTGKRACTQNLIKECISKSINQCTQPLQDWYREVATIRAEPKKTYQACLQNKQSVKQYQASIPALEATLRQAQAIILPQDNRSKVSLAEAICDQNQKRAGL